MSHHPWSYTALLLLDAGPSDRNDAYEVGMALASILVSFGFRNSCLGSNPKSHRSWEIERSIRALSAII